MTRFCQTVVESRTFQPVIIGVILVASVIVGLETSEYLMSRYGGFFFVLDGAILGIFAAEIILRIGAHGNRPWRFFLDPWNVFDFVIVVICFIPATGPFAAVLRLARILRVLRLVSAVPRLQLIVMALLRSIPSMGFIGLLLLLHFYIYAVIGVFFFARNDPMHFGTLWDAFLTLFRAVTLEDWTDLMYIQIYGSDVYPIEGFLGVAPQPEAFPLLSPFYFISFILFGTMIMLNLFIGVVVNSLHEVQLESEMARREKHRVRYGGPTMEDEIQALEHQLENVRNSLQVLRHRIASDEREHPEK
jgi:voltage-gated sodium channel